MLHDFSEVLKFFPTFITGREEFTFISCLSTPENSINYSMISL